MRKLILLIWLIISLMIPPAHLFAQKADSLINIYSQTHQPEKIHIHFDRSAYNKGDTIWMKLYLMAGTEFSDFSKNIYIDWFTPTGKLLQHASAPLVQSTARMQFAIPTSYEAGSLHAVAYTRWMLNFDSTFLYTKEIPVAQPQTAKADSPIPVSHLYFFPEGGDLVNGLLSYVAFKANDQFGNPVKVSGVVKTGAGVFVDSIVTVHDGMGSFSVTPKKNEIYTAYWEDAAGQTHTTPLPSAKESGVNLEIHPLQGKTLFVVRRTEAISDNSKMLHLVATMNQQLYYHFKLNLSAKTSAFSQFRTDSLPSGVLTISLLDANWLPLAERVVFVNNHEFTFQPGISFPVKSLDKRGKNIIQIDMPDTIASNLSVSVTDAGNINDSSNDIVSRFLLCSDIKGYVHNPAYYFLNKDASVAEQLDLVMLTHGWRRYNWDAIAAGKLPELNFKPEKDYVVIEGKAPPDLFEKMAAKPTLNVIVSSKQDGREVLSVTLSKEGSFTYRTGIFYDTVKVQYQFNGNKKIKGITGLHFENGLYPGLSLPAGFIQPPVWNSLSGGSMQAMIKTMLEEHERLEKLKASVTLKDVVVEAKTKTRLDLLDEKYAKGAFSGGGAYQFDIANDQMAQSAVDVLTYLQGRVPGLRYGHVSESVEKIKKTPEDDLPHAYEKIVLTWRTHLVSVYVNDMKLDTNDIEQSPILKSPMSNIAYIKIFPPIFYGFASDGAGGAIAIYLRDGAEMAIASDKSNDESMPQAFVAGYTRYKEFYSPDYSNPQTASYPDTRTTLYWNPYVFTDATNRSIQIPFYNNDHSKKLRVVMEGVNANKQFTRVEKIIE
jgi:hypothetical protein